MADTDRQVEVARELMRMGRYDKCSELLGQVLAASPQHAFALYILAICRLNQGRTEEAETVAGQSILANPQVHYGVLGLAQIRLRQSNLEAAEQLFLKTVAIETGDPFIWKVGASIALEQGDWEKACVRARAGLEIEPEHPGCTHALAEALSRSGRQEQATHHLMEALSRRPDEAAALDLLGYSMLMRGQWANAESAFRDALRNEPEDIHARAGLLASRRGRIPVVGWLTLLALQYRRVAFVTLCRANLVLMAVASGLWFAGGWPRAVALAYAAWTTLIWCLRPIGNLPLLLWKGTPVERSEIAQGLAALAYLAVGWRVWPTEWSLVLVLAGLFSAVTLLEQSNRAHWGWFVVFSVGLPAVGVLHAMSLCPAALLGVSLVLALMWLVGGFTVVGSEGLVV
ncbi:MAG: tetratricopeptide repeat protein [Candidatus Eremiobacterota bacterium]